MELTVGEMARRTGLTVRTLHHYDRIGLLRPAGRSAAGYRLYGEADVARLQAIVSLKQLGFSLGQVKDYLAVSHPLPELLRLQLERLHERIEAERALYRRLQSVINRLETANGAGGAGEVSADELLRTIEATIMFEKHFTPEQMARLAERREELGDAAIRAAEEEWPQLIARVKECMARGIDPMSEEMRPLALRWKELVGQFTGGDPAVAASLGRMYREEPSARERTGLDMALFDYVGKAMAGIGGWQ